MKGADTMSDNFENNNGFDENVNPSENNTESFENPSVSEPESTPTEPVNDFSSGEYHFSYRKPSSFGENASQPSDSNASSTDTDDRRDTGNGYAANDSNPVGGTGYYYGNTNAGSQNGSYTPYNWNSQSTGNNPGTGYRNYNGQQNGYYGQSGQPQRPNPYANGYRQPTPPQPKKGKGGKTVALVVVIAVVVIAVVSIVIGAFSKSGPSVQPSTTSPAAQGSDVTGTTNTQSAVIATTNAASPVQLSAVEVAEKARKSVVGVMTYKNGQLSGEGSGVVMGLDSTGEYTYIITCAHVINESGVTFGVQTLDDKKYTAEMVATDTRTDIGVLKVKANDLPTAEFGDSTTLKVGETVYAIGNPGGSEYFGSMTDGIVSAIDRSVSSTYNITCIQHNAAINPGNSGGALVNAAGQVIGINSSKIAATDYEGMGFAIPMATVSSVVDDLIKYKYVPNRPKLGIEYASVDRYQLYSMVVAMKGLPAGSLVIAGISKDSSLANTDAQVGDMIIGVNGQPMTTSDVLLDLIDTGAVGDSITLNLCRVDNRTYKITKFDVKITLVEDKGDASQQEETTEAPGNYDYGGAGSFDDFFNQYFGGFGGFGN